MLFKEKDVNSLKLRAPGPMERWFIALHDQEQFYAVGATSRIHPPPTTIFNQAVVFAAFGKLISQHAALGISLRGPSERKPRFARLHKIDLTKIVEVVQLSEDADRDAVVRANLESKYSSPLGDFETTPLWRAVVFLPPSSSNYSEHGIDITFYVHHTIGDGMAACNFPHLFLGALSTVDSASHLSAESIVDVPILPLEPELESLVSFSMSFFFVLKSFWKEWFPRKREGLWLGPPIKPGPFQAGHTDLVYPPTAVSTLVGACRAHNSTVTSLLSAILARELLAVLPDAASVAVMLPVSLRRFFKSPESAPAFGSFVASVTEETARETQGPLWDGASHAHEKVKTHLARGARDFDCGLLPFVWDMREILRAHLKGDRQASASISNVGVVDGSPQGGWRISRTMFSQSSCVYLAPVSISVCTVAGGDMCISFDWSRGAGVPDEFVENLAARVGEAIEEVVREASN
ncbi:alcohol acetyltransferase-domain-containing protein [Gloeopeniophorella convolvens]|nr:alcohol acetyltransferase-domain-containing protein [Gloeopeniophorella convolvens]